MATKIENYVRVVLEDANQNEFVVPIYNYKSDITFNDIVEAFQVIIDTNVWYSPSGSIIAGVKKADILHLDITEEDII